MRLYLVETWNNGEQEAAPPDIRAFGDLAKATKEFTRIKNDEFNIDNAYEAVVELVEVDLVQRPAKALAIALIEGTGFKGRRLLRAASLKDDPVEYTEDAQWAG